MSTYTATVDWSLNGEFAKGRYSRGHQLSFDGGVTITGSASPSVVPLPYALKEAVDPEELLVASLASCHMLTFLDIARRAGWSIDRYIDTAEGRLAKNAQGRLAVTEVILRPKISFVGPEPKGAVLDALHHQAHEACFIANSVTTTVTVETP